MRARLLTFALAAGLLAGSSPVLAKPSRQRPRAFASCSSLVSYAKRNFARTHGLPERLPPFEGGPPTAGPGSVSNGQVGAGAQTNSAQAAPAPTAPNASDTQQTYSTTNVQEAGIDEPDVVKSNGSTLFVVSQNTLYAVGVSGGAPRILGSLGLGSYGAQLLLRGNRLIAILHPAPSYPVPLAAASYPSPYYYPATTVLVEVNIANPAAMAVTRWMTIDGTFVDARQNGGSARLVISSAPRAIARPDLRNSPKGWIPHRTFSSLLSGRHYNRLASPCGSISRPAQFSGLGMLTILTLDLDRGLWAADSKAVLADAQVVYGSPSSLYVATQRWVDPRTQVDELPPSSTVIDRFDATDPRRTTFRAAGAVPGYVLNQFSLSEYGGHLRVATTSRPPWWSNGAPIGSQSYVTVLATHGGSLERVGQVAGLGQGQQIRSVRFVGPAGYVVTFRQVDPLYVVDLSSPTRPRVTGQLELEGYSSYLHPLSPGLLLGVGRAVGETSGVQLEVFDVSNPSAPRVAGKVTLDNGSSSPAEFDHHAFLYWQPTGLALLPVTIFGPPRPCGGAQYPCCGPPQPQPANGPAVVCPAQGQSGSPIATGANFNGAIGYRVGAGGIAEVGRISQDALPEYQRAILRAAVVGNVVYTVSNGGVMASGLSDLSPGAFAAFPGGNQQPPPAIEQAQAPK